MKKYLKLALFSLLSATLLPLSGCGDKQNDSGNNDKPDIVEPKPDVKNPIENDSGLPTEIAPLNEPGFQIHYQRLEGTYTEWGMWLWAEGKDGVELPFNYQDDYGVIAYYPLSYFGNPKSVGFIVKKLKEVTGGDWVKDGDYDRFLDIQMLEKDENETYHVYIRSKTKDVFTDKDRTKIMNAVKSVQFEDPSKITIDVNNPMKDPVLRKNGEIVEDATITGKGTKRTIKLGTPADVADNYTVDIEFENGGKVSKNVSVRKLYTTDFDNKYYYDGELGAIYTPQSTTFRVWSPISTSIKLRIYNNGTPTSVNAEKGDDTYVEHEMIRNKEKGIFEITLDGDLEGKYYTYFVTNGYNPLGAEIVDPYAKSAGVSGKRGMIVDFSKTNPAGFEELGYDQTDKKELTVYETHVSDLTSAENWNGTPSKAKKFLGMIEEGTTYKEGETTVSTGFDHIKELGVNALQVVPFYDQANDETKMEFNWGYNPLNYNVVEGSYSSDPYDGYVRIRELKQVIQAYKETGMSFIMDVVYNHVSGLAGSNFDILMPFYYFRYTDTGGASSGSGCGNDTASEKRMFRKFMIDSTEFWTKEYKIDGFRFDLMGLHDLNTMNNLVRNLKKINPNVTVYGEAWIMGTSAAPNTTLTNQNAANRFDSYGQFNDKGRDAIVAGGMKPKESRGWMNSTNNPVETERIKDMIKGITSSVTTDPNKTVNYVACHDNYTLHDRNIAAGIYDEEFIRNANMISQSVVMTSNGISFMLSGDEINRSKIIYNEDGTPKIDETVKDQEVYEVSHNSYNLPYKTNEIDWSLKVKNLDMFETYKKLIWLKQNINDLHLNEDEIKASTTFTVGSERNDTIIKTTFSDDTHDYTAYFGQASLYKYEKDSADPYNIDLTGKEVYLATRHTLTNETEVTLSPLETIIVRTPKKVA